MESCSETDSKHRYRSLLENILREGRPFRAIRDVLTGMISPIEQQIKGNIEFDSIATALTELLRFSTAWQARASRLEYRPPELCLFYEVCRKQNQSNLNEEEVLEEYEQGPALERSGGWAIVVGLSVPQRPVMHTNHSHKLILEWMLKRMHSILREWNRYKDPNRQEQSKLTNALQSILAHICSIQHKSGVHELVLKVLDFEKVKRKLEAADLFRKGDTLLYWNVYSLLAQTDTDNATSEQRDVCLAKYHSTTVMLMLEKQHRSRFNSGHLEGLSTKELFTDINVKTERTMQGLTKQLEGQKLRAIKDELYQRHFAERSLKVIDVLEFLKRFDGLLQTGITDTTLELEWGPNETATCEFNPPPIPIKITHQNVHSNLSTMQVELKVTHQLSQEQSHSILENIRLLCQNSPAYSLAICCNAILVRLENSLNSQSEVLIWLLEALDKLALVFILVHKEKLHQGASVSAQAILEFEALMKMITEGIQGRYDIS